MTLDDIKAAVAEYEAAEAYFNSRASNNLDLSDPVFKKNSDAYDWVNVNAPDALRKLIAVAETAREFVRDTDPMEMAVLSTAGHRALAYSERRNKLADALKALE